MFSIRKVELKFVPSGCRNTHVSFRLRGPCLDRLQNASYRSPELLCRKQAALTSFPEARIELERMAREYQQDLLYRDRAERGQAKTATSVNTTVSASLADPNRSLAGPPRHAPPASPAGKATAPDLTAEHHPPMGRRSMERNRSTDHARRTRALFRG
jgi:hypothetical protein